jgi:NADH dehydrogenase (ubiquinone) flavoprotein 2
MLSSSLKFSSFFSLKNKTTFKLSQNLKFSSKFKNFLKFPKGFSTVYVNHRDTFNNNDKTPFDFTPENYKQVEVILSRYPKTYMKSAVMPLLYVAQKQNGNHVTLSAMQKIAKILEIPDMAVFEVASFYTMYNRTPVGKFHLQMCGTTPCMVRGAKEVIDTALEYLGVEKDHVTEDGLFCVTEVECLGACVNAPMMQVNNEWFYEDLNKENIIKVIEKFRKGEHIQWGPQINRNFSEGPQGRNSLHHDFESKPISRDFVDAKKQWEAARAKVNPPPK